MRLKSKKRSARVYEETVPAEELDDTREDRFGRVFTRAAKPAGPNIVPLPLPDGDEDGRRLAGINVDGKSQTRLSDAERPAGVLFVNVEQWGWPELAIPIYFKSHVHKDNLDEGQTILISTFRLAVQIHTRSANAKWLDEIAHTNPLWIHPTHAAKLSVRTGDLVRVETEIGYYVVPAWVTEGIRPGIVACSHHMGRWKLTDEGQRQLMATVKLDQNGTEWR